MKALFATDGTIEVRESPRPTPPDGEALVRVRRAGICNTDLELMRGYLDFDGVLGHEFVGEVVESEDQSLVGTRVVGEINVTCSDCDFCRRGLGRHCSHLKQLGIRGHNGAHAEYLTLPNANLLPVPDAVSDEAAVFTEPLAAACEILEQVHMEPAHRVAVIGDGKLGLLVAQVLALTGCELHVIGRHRHKLDILAQRGIVTEAVPRGEETTLPDRWADIVVEITGNESGFQAARRLLKPRGILVLKSTYAGAVSVDLAQLVVDEITLVGSRCGPFPAALRLLEQGRVDVTPLIHDEFPLSRGAAAYKRAMERDVLKVLLDPAGGATASSH